MNEMNEGLAVLQGVLQAPMSKFSLPTTSTTLSYFQTTPLLNQYLSTLSCHSLGLVAAALRLELRGTGRYSFQQLFDEHILFLQSWSVNQPNINPIELFTGQENCLEMYEQLITDQIFVYCTKLNVDQKITRQLNLDVFVVDDDDDADDTTNGTGNNNDGDDGNGGNNGEKKQRKLAVINKGNQPHHVIAIHPLQYQLHQFVKRNNAMAPLINIDKQSTTGAGVSGLANTGLNNNKDTTSGAAPTSTTTATTTRSTTNQPFQQQLINKVKIQCVISRQEFFDFLSEYKAHLNKVRFIDPLNFESVPIWVDSLLDTDIKTTSNV